MGTPIVLVFYLCFRELHRNMKKFFDHGVSKPIRCQTSVYRSFFLIIYDEFHQQINPIGLRGLKVLLFEANRIDPDNEQLEFYRVKITSLIPDGPGDTFRLKF